VSALGEKLVEHVVGTRCARHTWYAIPRQYFKLLVLSLIVTVHCSTVRELTRTRGQGTWMK
jgi:hypothetical protein